MGIKEYNKNRITFAESAQLIILHILFSRKESKDIIFQGGTAIRWCYGGNRFSEDLDFVTPLTKKAISKFINSIKINLKNEFIAHFGIGNFAIKEKETTRESSYKAFVEFYPLNKREKISIKVEFEKLKKNIFPEYKKVLLTSLSSVSFLIQKENILIPPFGSIINVETEEELFTDKIRALLERVYIKGRDFYDIWFLIKTLNMKPDIEILNKKFDMYEAPFNPARKIQYYTEIDKIEQKEKKELLIAIENDLSRFIHPDIFNVLKQDNFFELIDNVKEIFCKLQVKKYVKKN